MFDVLFSSGDYSLEVNLIMKSVYAFSVALDYAIKAATGECGGGKAFSRKSPLTRETVIRLLLGAEGGPLEDILHDAHLNVTPSALTQRRAQLPPEVFHAVLKRFNASCPDTEFFRDYQLLAVDGTTIDLPRNPASPSFVQHEGIQDGVNQLHVTPLYDIISRTFTDVVIQPEPKKDEIGAVVQMLERNTFKQKTLVIADRGFESYNLIAHCLEKDNIDFLIRIKQSYSAMREVAKLPMVQLDCNVSFTLTTTQTNEDKRQAYIHLSVPKKSKAGSKTRHTRWDFPSPYSMKFRICRFQLSNGEFETVATSLPQSFSLEDIRELYHLRWGIEASFRDLKYTLGLVNLHGRSDMFAQQEIFAALTTFNFASRVCQLAVVRQPTNGVYAYKVNFKKAVARCKEFLRTPNASGETLLKDIACNPVPIRPGRQDPRNLRVKSFAGFAYRVAA